MITHIIKMSSDIMSLSEPKNNSMIREEAQSTIKVPNIQIRTKAAIADLALDVIAYRKSTKIRKVSLLKRVMILVSLVVPLPMVIAQMVEYIESLTLVIFNTRLGIHLGITKSLDT